MVKIRRAALFAAFLTINIFAIAEEGAHDALVRARGLSGADAIQALENALPNAGSLRPYYYAELARRYGEAENWKKSVDYSLLAESAPLSVGSLDAATADSVAWWHATALDRSGRKPEAVAIVGARISSGSVVTPSVFLAWFSWAEVGAKGGLSAFDRAFPSAREKDSRTWALSRYLGGLCAVREGDWSTAETALSDFLRYKGSDLSAYVPWGTYYRAYSLYRLKRWLDAATVFSQYIEGKNHPPNEWQAASFAALSTLLSGGDALPLATRAVELAPTSEDRARSLSFRATILIDGKKYDEAESALMGVADGSSTNGLTSSAPRALFALAEISARKRDAAESEKRWQTFVTRYPKDPLAEDALYRAGESRYLAGDWDRAAAIFSDYRKRWPSGKYLASALRSGGDAYRKLGKTDLAILWWEELVKKYPASSAASPTMSDLIGAYRDKGEYARALDAANSFRRAYPDEAISEEIGRTIAELEILKKGGSADIATLVAEWNDSGMAATARGRSAGLSLARRYAADYGTRGEAKKILGSITAASPKKTDGLSTSERGTFAGAWFLSATMSRDDSDFAGAARAYIAAGDFYAALDGERAAEALYGAVDCFARAGFPADAARAAETLAATWPNSDWARRARFITE